MTPERVCDYPRPPLVEQRHGPVLVRLGGDLIAQSETYVRVCETYHPPTIYIPIEAFQSGTLHPTTGRPSFCEWKGIAHYWDLSNRDGQHRQERAAWSYPTPTDRFKLLAGWISLYPGLMQSCHLEGELVSPQPGCFYGGWITSMVMGPFKGDPLHPELI